MRTQAAEIFGSYFSMRHLCKALIHSKIERHFYWKEIEFYNLPLFKFIKKIFQLQNSIKFDIIFIRDDLLLLILGLILKKRYKLPVLIHYTIPIKFITDFDFKWYHPKRIGGTIKHLLTLKLMKKVDLVLPTSEWMGKYLISMGIKKEKIHNYPNGANLDLFFPTPYPKDEENPTYIYIGSVSKIRKLDILLFAMEKVCKKYPKAHLYMLGYGDDINDLLLLAEKLDIKHNVTFTGQIPYDEVPKYLNKSHITLCSIAPLYHYKLASPLKLFEYMSSSRPVIANKEIPAHIRPIKQSKCGLLVNFTSESFADAMIKIFEDPLMADEMGKNGRKWLKENRSYEKIAKKLESKIFKLIE
jgi:glycosyltransferase involved in cell wall biosynthesis